MRKGPIFAGGDIPQIMASAYAGTAYGLGLGQLVLEDVDTSSFGGKAANFKPQQQETPTVAEKIARRLVKVIIVDANENIPLDDCVIYAGVEKITDLTDQELFFEVDLKGLLDKHNEKRVKIVDKTIKDRTEYLEPVRIRELKMVVVNIASF